MADDLRLLHTPLGVPGSGRVRYGAAMTFFRAGRISEAQLEVYREAAAHDARDPALMLSERGLPAVAMPDTSPDEKIARLAETAEDYLRGLVHPGAEEVRIVLAARGGWPRLPPPRRNAVVSRWLADALGPLAASHPALATAIADAAPHLGWITYDRYPPADIGASFATGHAFAPILGEDAPYPASDREYGLFLIAPGVLYRDHAHAAPELYAPLTGPHDWRFATTAPLVSRSAHNPVWNPPHRPHLIRAGAVPFLSFYVWTRDVGEPAYVIPAEDWHRLEASTP